MTTSYATLMTLVGGTLMPLGFFVLIYLQSRIFREPLKSRPTEADYERIWRHSLALKIFFIPVILFAHFALLQYRFDGVAKSPLASIGLAFYLLMIALILGHLARPVYGGWTAFRKTQDGYRFIRAVDLKQNLRPKNERFGENGSVRID